MELRRLPKDAAVQQEMLAQGYEILPDLLNPAAIRALQGRDSVTISRHSGGTLSSWAAQRRKARNKMARESRKRNRR